MMMLSHGVDHAGLRRGREMIREQGGKSEGGREEYWRDSML
jgi:hypothetical protein